MKHKKQTIFVGGWIQTHNTGIYSNNFPLFTHSCCDKNTKKKQKKNNREFPTTFKTILWNAQNLSFRYLHFDDLNVFFSNESINYIGKGYHQ